MEKTKMEVVEVVEGVMIIKKGRTLAQIELADVFADP